MRAPHLGMQAGRSSAKCCVGGEVPHNLHVVHGPRPCHPCSRLDLDPNVFVVLGVGEGGVLWATLACSILRPSRAACPSRAGWGLVNESPSRAARPTRAGAKTALEYVFANEVRCSLRGQQLVIKASKVGALRPLSAQMRRPHCDVDGGAALTVTWTEGLPARRRGREPARCARSTPSSGIEMRPASNR